MKKLKYISMMLFLAVLCLPMVSCSSSDDEPEADIATRIAGNYVGTVKPVGYSDEPARAYATLTRKAQDAVSFEISCEEFDIEYSPVNLIINEKADGSAYLTSESNYAIDATVSGDALSASFKYGGYTFYFSGKKN